MSSYTDRPDVLDVLKNYFWTFILIALCVASWSQYSNYFFFVYKLVRMIELLVWDYTINLVYTTDFFSNGIAILKQKHSDEMTWGWMFNFEAHFNQYLRFFYALPFFLVGGKIIYNRRYVTKQLNVQSMLELWRHEAEAIDVLVHDNPLKHHRVYDFSNRDDYYNRHAQAMSPTAYFSACPPVNASDTELEEYCNAVEEERDHVFRPIAIIDKKKQKLDFSRQIAKQSYERQLTNPPVEDAYYNNPDNAPRLFDSDGELVPLQFDNDKRVVGGFSRDKLLNGGRRFEGEPEDVALLFDYIERDVFYTLVDRYNNPSYPIEKLVVDLTRLHAYTRTYLVALLNIVRQNAVIASTEFYLLCRTDRILYFALYSATEEKPFYEAEGVMGHYAYEVKLGKAITFPCVDKAVQSLYKEAKRVAAWKPRPNDILTQLAHNLKDDVKSPPMEERITDDLIDSTFEAMKSDTVSSQNGENDASIVRHEVSR